MALVKNMRLEKLTMRIPPGFKTRKASRKMSTGRCMYWIETVIRTWAGFCAQKRHVWGAKFLNFAPPPMSPKIMKFHAASWSTWHDTNNLKSTIFTISLRYYPEKLTCPRNKRDHFGISGHKFHLPTIQFSELLYFEWSPPWHVGWWLSGGGCQGVLSVLFSQLVTKNHAEIPHTCFLDFCVLLLCSARPSV